MIEPEIVERMEKLVRRVAETVPIASCGKHLTFIDHDEALTIVALLPEPVDPDIAEVDRLIDESPMLGGSVVHEWMLKALKRGRQLAKDQS